MKIQNPIRFALLAAAALFTHAAFAGKPTPPPPPPPPPSSGTVVLDYLGLQGGGAANFGLTVAPSGAIYASGVSGDSAIVLASGDSGNSWSLADIYPPPGRYVTYLEIAGGITSDAAGNLYATGWTWDDAADQRYVRRSTDGGATWATVDDFPHNASGDAVGIAADATGDVYVAGNLAWTIRKGVGGTSFSTVDVLPNSWVKAIFAHPTAGIIAVGSQTVVINNNASSAWTVRRSLDGGATWSNVDTFQLQSGLSSTALGIGADAVGNLYVVGRGDNSPRRNTVFRYWLVRKSTDGGNSWSTVDAFLPGGHVEARGFAAKANGDLYVAGTTTSSTGYRWIVRKSAGGTGAWTTIDDYQYAGGRTEPHAIAAEAAGNLFVGGNGGGHWLIKKY